MSSKCRPVVGSLFGATGYAVTFAPAAAAYRAITETSPAVQADAFN